MQPNKAKSSLFYVITKIPLFGLMWQNVCTLHFIYKKLENLWLRTRKILLDLTNKGTMSLMAAYCTPRGFLILKWQHSGSYPRKNPKSPNTININTPTVKWDERVSGDRHVQVRAPTEFLKQKKIHVRTPTPSLQRSYFTDISQRSPRLIISTLRW